MRNYFLLLISVLVLISCSGHKVYKNKGISYFAKPQQEIEKITHFPVPTPGEFPVMITHSPVANGDVVFFLTETRYKTGMNFVTYSTVYSLDSKNLSVKDSLLIKEEGKSNKFRNIVIGENVYLVGIRDSVCIIYAIDKNLKKLHEFNTGINAQNLYYAGNYQGSLRLVISNMEKSAILYDLNKDMLPIRQRLLLKNTYAGSIDKDRLWFHEVNDNALVAAKFDLSQADPAPLQDIYNISIPDDGRGNRPYNFVLSDNAFYLSYSRIKPEGGYMSRLHSVNINNKATQTRDFEGTFGFDILKRDDKTYLYYSKQYDNPGSKQAITISEIADDLTDINEKLCFYVSPLINSTKHIVAIGDSKVIITGNYLINNGKKTKIDIPGVNKNMWDDYDSSCFIALYELKR